MRCHRLLLSGLLTHIDLVAQTERHSLGLCSDPEQKIIIHIETSAFLPDMSCHWSLGFGQIFLQADIGQSILAEYRLCIQISGHEAALALQGLVRSETLHVGAGQETVEVPHQLVEGRVDRHLVLPLELRPHRSELGLCAGGGNDVVHDVDVNVIEDHHVPVAGGAGHVINNVSENNSILC